MKLVHCLILPLLAITSATYSWAGDAFPLRRDYRGEETRGVLYLTDEQREQYRVIVNESGLLVKASDGGVFSSYLTGEPTLFVLMENEELYISAFSRHNVFHHSSLSSGKAVKSAGQALIFQGRVIALDNVSGHYYPSLQSVSLVINRLAQMGYRETEKITVSSAAFVEQYKHFESLFCTALFRPLVN